MDKLSELTHGAKVVLGCAILLFIFSFFNWFTLGPFGENMWHGIGFVAGLTVIALIVWQAVRLANIKLEVGVTQSMVTAVLSILLLIFVFIRFIDKPGSGAVSDAIDRSIWAWLGLILAIIIVGGAWANMKMSGESLTEWRSKDSGGTAPAAPAATPAPPSAPAETPPPEAPPSDETC
jgi:hypothetical protein